MTDHFSLTPFRQVTVKRPADPDLRSPDTDGELATVAGGYIRNRRGSAAARRQRLGHPVLLVQKASGAVADRRGSW